jgi:hypothetical protein
VRPPTLIALKSAQRRLSSETHPRTFSRSKGVSDSTKCSLIYRKITSANILDDVNASLAHLGGVSDARCVMPAIGSTFCAAATAMSTSARNVAGTASE